jgi:hypothetical protein
MTIETFPKPIRQTIMVADLKCYMCGAIVGSIESDQEPEPHAARARPRAVRFRKTGQNEMLPVLDWRHLRCDRCSGPTYLDEPDIIVRRIEEYDWMDERPRRGRPPKRLVEERRRQRERLDSQAA